MLLQTDFSASHCKVTLIKRKISSPSGGRLNVALTRQWDTYLKATTHVAVRPSVLVTLKPYNDNYNNKLVQFVGTY